MTTTNANILRREDSTLATLKSVLLPRQWGLHRDLTDVSVSTNKGMLIAKDSDSKYHSFPTSEDVDARISSAVAGIGALSTKWRPTVDLTASLGTIASPSTGDMTFAYTDNILYKYTGGAWTEVYDYDKKTYQTSAFVDDNRLLISDFSSSSRNFKASIYSMPASDGTTGQFLKTDGAGTLSWGTGTSVNDFTTWNYSAVDYGVWNRGSDVMALPSSSIYIGVNGGAVARWAYLGEASQNSLFIGYGTNSTYNQYTVTSVGNTGVGSYSLASLSGGSSLRSYNTALGTYSMYTAVTGESNTSIGWGSLYTANGAHNNTATGYSVLFSLTTGDSNTATGSANNYSLTTGELNSSYGFNSAYYGTTASRNSNFGAYSLNFNVTGNDNAAYGYYSMLGVTTQSHSQNSAFGAYSLSLIQSGADNCAFGFENQKNVSTGAGNTSSGSQSLKALTTGVQNTFSGMYSGNALVSGSYNTISGYQGLYLSTTSSYNSGFGFQIMASGIVTGGSNSAFGRSSLLSLTSGDNNSAYGSFSLRSLTTGSSNTAGGYASSYSLTTSSSTTSYGFESSYTAVTALGNSSFGNKALKFNLAGDYNSAFGNGAMEGLSSYSSSYNTAFGHLSLNKISGGAGYNSAYGQYSMPNLTTGELNTSVGSVSFENLTTGSKNTAIGEHAGDELTTGDYNIYVGYGTTATSASVSNELMISSRGSTAASAIIYGAMSTTAASQTLDLNARVLSRYGHWIYGANDLRLYDSDSSHYVGFKSPATVATSLIWTLPDADGTAGQTLSTNGSGVLSWASGGASQWTTSGSSIYYNNPVVVKSGTIDAAIDFQVGSNDGTSTNNYAVGIGSALNTISASIGGGIAITTQSHATASTATVQKISFRHRKNDGTGLGAYSEISSTKTAGADTSNLAFYYGSAAATTTLAMTLTTNGQLALEYPLQIKETTVPSSTSGYGKIWVNSASNFPHFLDDGGTDYELINGSVIQTIDPLACDGTGLDIGDDIPHYMVMYCSRGVKVTGATFACTTYISSTSFEVGIYSWAASGSVTKGSSGTVSVTAAGKFDVAFASTVTLVKNTFYFIAIFKNSAVGNLLLAKTGVPSSTAITFQGASVSGTNVLPATESTRNSSARAVWIGLY